MTDIRILLDKTQLAATLRVSARKVLELTRQGKIPVVRLGPRTYRWVLSDVLEALR
jgi:excisionase family DNA binding protein